MAGVEGNQICSPIYPKSIKPIKRREKEEEIIGSKAQFCAAFYHVHEWHYTVRGTTEHHCLDEDSCIIAERAKMSKKQSNWHVQPKDVVAVVKFEDREKNTLYEARYTNCRPQKMHAEDFFKYDIEEGDLKEIVRENEGGRITMYLTLQPCNRSTSLEGTENTRANQSCCEKLVKIYSRNLRRRNIDLCVKVTHMCRLNLVQETGEDEILRQRAVAGVTALMLIGVEVKEMTKGDWEYLFKMTEANVPENKESRQKLDKSVQKTLAEVELFTKSLTKSLSLLSSVVNKLQAKNQ
ncbi:uncharacterized protein LOC114536880 [Dendronephthya gigantea]|uniref:uncharacterized protein LOC114536880 n=1 Tax=Dendronephthya gigantea TaxID=151771 RepID=UPI00106C61F2|nr:uncharacterized protein LOC114536880 [Dendronephthya gigantea]XP_028414009.1 uncharacterized protein LOC114536880 [Dendronephthya gigantea]